jgi:hypothetical protein
MVSCHIQASEEAFSGLLINLRERKMLTRILTGLLAAIVLYIVCLFAGLTGQLNRRVDAIPERPQRVIYQEFDK